MGDFMYFNSFFVSIIVSVILCFFRFLTIRFCLYLDKEKTMVKLYGQLYVQRENLHS